MDLSVIIVNYNVRYFLEQCLHSVYRAAEGLEVEVIVTDNNSTDDSVSYLKERFPKVHFICNNHNAGFGKACNQGLQQATGRYILFLNPDTLIGEETLSTAIRYLEMHPEAGALGVRMIDGSGNFLKESKRSFPSPLTAMYKLFGLSMLFPRSRVFGRYHLGHLSEFEDHEVDVLAGAFLLVPRAVLDRTGSFDEAFFMYGEDVDLSYRIQAAGYKNIYFAGTTIIHFKGESTRRGSLNYVRMFYNAMHIFVRKHYGGARAGLFRGSIQVAIGIRAAMAAMAKGIRSIGLPVIDAALILLSFWLVKEFWVAYIRTDIVYPEKLLRLSFPVYTIAFIITAYYAGLYDRIYRSARLLRSTAVATLVLLALYALLPESWRFSRGILFFGALLAMLLIGWVRHFLLRAGVIQQPPESVEKPFLLVAASEEEYGPIYSLLQKHNRHTKVIGRVGRAGEKDIVATMDNIIPAAETLNAEELVLCAGSFSYTGLIQETARIRGRLRLRYHAAGSNSIVGSDSSGTSGETLAPVMPLQLDDPGMRRAKRMSDLLLALIFLLTFPVALFLVKNFTRFFSHCIKVIGGRLSWVGYITAGAKPVLRPGVLAPNGMLQKDAAQMPGTTKTQLDEWYARDYEPLQEMALVLKNYRRLGG